MNSARASWSSAASSFPSASQSPASGKHERRRPAPTTASKHSSETSASATMPLMDGEDDDGEGDEVDAHAEYETNVLRYFTTRLMLRYVLNPSDEMYRKREKGPLLSVYEPTGGSKDSNSALFLSKSSTSSLLGKAPALIVLPPVTSKHQSSALKDPRVKTGVFMVIPAEGFEKEPNQPVCYYDPVQLVDQSGRILGIVSRSPFAGQLAADGHGGALVFVLQRQKSQEVPCVTRLQKYSRETASFPQSTPQYQVCKKLGLRRQSTIDSVVEICGGDRVIVPGLIRVSKTPFLGGCIMQHQFFSDSLEDVALPQFLTCEVVITSGNKHLPIDVNPLIGGEDFVLAKSKMHMADRTATGEFVGILHSGILHRQSDHTKIWRKRFFVLTQVALHRFEANVTIATIKSAKSRGDVLVKDCRRVRYEKFARPHELEVELHNGKLLVMHSEDAVSCARWAAVLSNAIENPRWLHTETTFTTIWRSDDRYESPSCPRIERLVFDQLSRHRCAHKSRLVASRPQWNEKLSLGQFKAGDHVMVHLSNGDMFTLSLEDISRALLKPSSSSLHSTVLIASENGRDELTGDDHITTDDTGRLRSSTSSSDSIFLVRLKYRTELKLDRRVEPKFVVAVLLKKLVLLSASVIGSTCLLYKLFRYKHQGLPSLSEMMENDISPAVSSIYFQLIIVPIQVFAIVLVAPVIWHIFILWHRRRMKEAKLHWFLTLLSLEVRPKVTQGQYCEKRDWRNVCPVEDSSDWVAVACPEKRLFCKQRSDDVYRFRLENALESILGRPQFSYFAIKSFFPNKFLRRDEEGRRVLLISLSSVSWASLSHHNLSLFAVERYFFFLWEFIWSYSDFCNGVVYSELIIVLDCSGWTYWSLFQPAILMIYDVLIKTCHYYPGRLVKVVFAGVGHSTWTKRYAQLFRAFFPPDLRPNCSLASSLTEALDLVYRNTASRTEEQPYEHSADEQSLSEFVSTLLSTYAIVSIPSFTKREIDQATRFTKFGNLQAGDDKLAASSSNARRVSKAIVGTKALLIPETEAEWKPLYHHDEFHVYLSRNLMAKRGISEEGSSIPDQILQLRGTLKMASTDIEMMLLSLQDPSQWKLWSSQDDKMILLDTLADREDVCFWSRQIPFLSFSNCGTRIEEVSHTGAYFDCVVRRVYEEHKSTHGSHSSYTVLWKTTTSHQHIISDKWRRESDTASSASDSQWRKFEDPFATVCFVLEPRFATGVDERDLDGIDLSFWFQVLGPAAKESALVEVAQHIETKYRGLDAFLQKASSDRSRLTPSALFENDKTECGLLAQELP